MAETVHTDYKEKVTLRFLEAMRRILMARVKGCKTVSQFAAFIGEHPQNISKMENGTRFPTIDQVCRLCEVFGYSPNWLLLGKGNMEDTAELSATVAILKDKVTKIELQLEQLTAKKK
jgi:transcriptional regulator with XRE-family HTH domain